MIKGRVSVIIPTFNTSKDKENPIDKCIESIMLSTYRNIEIITIDENRERSAQRNIGIKCARGEYILYLDDDQYVAPELIKECVCFISLYKMEAIYIPEIIVTNNWFGHLRNWERQFYTGTPIDCVRFFRAEGCPTFDETMSGPEDADFSNSIKGLKGIVNSCLYHDDSVTLISYLKKKAYYAKSMEAYKKKWPNDKVLSFWYRCFWVFMEQGKWKLFLRKPHYAFMVMSFIFLRGLIYVFRRRGC